MGGGRGGGGAQLQAPPAASPRVTCAACLLQPSGTPASLQDSARCCGCGTSRSVLSRCAMLITLWSLYLAARAVAEECKYLLPSCLAVCLHVREFWLHTLQGERCERDAALPACVGFSLLPKKDVDHRSVKDQSEVPVSLPVCLSLAVQRAALMQAHCL